MFKYTNLFQKKNQQQTAATPPPSPAPSPAPAPLPPRGGGFYPGAGQQAQQAAQPAAGAPEKKPAPTEHKNGFNLKTYLLYALLIGLGIALAKAGFDYVLPRFTAKPIQATIRKVLPVQLPFTSKQDSTPAKTQNATVDLAPAKVEKLTGEGFSVSGIFVADNSAESTAIINNQIVSVGDTVDKATVREIDMDGVVLEKDGQTIRITNR